MTRIFRVLFSALLYLSLCVAHADNNIVTTDGKSTPATIIIDGVTGIPINLNSPLPTSLLRAFTPTVNSIYGSIAAANVDQMVVPANASRHGLVVSVTTNSPGAIAFRWDGGLVWDAVNSDYAGTYIQPGGTVIFDSSMSNTAITAASPSIGARYVITEY